MSIDAQGRGQSLRQVVSVMADGWSKPAPGLYTADKKRVYIHSGLYLPGAVAEHLPHALSTVVSHNHAVAIREIEFDYFIGSSYIVEIGDDDAVVDVRRPGKEYTSKCVLGRIPQETNLLTVVLLRSPEDRQTYILTGAWIGGRLETEENDDISLLNRTKQQRRLRRDILSARKQFWEHHALCLEFVWLMIADLALADHDSVRVENGELRIKLVPTT